MEVPEKNPNHAFATPPCEVRPIMRSVNIVMTRDIAAALKSRTPHSRSAAVRDAASIVLEAYERGHHWVFGVIQEKIEESAPGRRRADEANGISWSKAIVWIPESMYREINRICQPNKIRISDFLRGVVLYAAEDAKDVDA